MTTARHTVLNDRTVNRLIVGLIVLLAIGIPAIAAFYYMDRHLDGGPSIAQRAIDDAEAAVRAEPNKLSTRVALGVAYAANDRYQDAIEQFDVVLAEDPNNRVALLRRGDAHRNLANLDSAASDYQAFIEMAKDEEMRNVDPQLEAAYYGLGAVRLAQDQPRDAATSLANALVIDGTDADALDLLGQALTRIGDYDAAASALRDAVALVPTGWCDPYQHMADAYQGKSDGDGVAYASAMVAFCNDDLAAATAGLEPLTNGAYARDALIGLGLVAEARGDGAGAADYYSRVVATNPDDFAAITGLGRVGGEAPRASGASATASPGAQ